MGLAAQEESGQFASRVDSGWNLPPGEGARLEAQNRGGDGRARERRRGRWRGRFSVQAVRRAVLLCAPTQTELKPSQKPTKGNKTKNY